MDPNERRLTSISDDSSDRSRPKSTKSAHTAFRHHKNITEKSYSVKSLKSAKKSSKGGPSGVGKTNSEMFLVVEQSSTPAIKTTKHTPKVVISKGKIQHKDELPLVEKLLGEIVSKYNPNLTMNSAYLSRLEKKTMITEIRMLSKALIKSEKANHKLLDKQKAALKQVKADKMELDFRLQNSLRRQ